MQLHSPKHTVDSGKVNITPSPNIACLTYLGVAEETSAHSVCVLSVLPSPLAIRIRDGQSSALELSTVGGTGYLRTQRGVQQLGFRGNHSRGLLAS